MYRAPRNQESFDQSVWEIVKRIPAGSVATYGQLAGLVQIPEGEDPQTYRAFGPRWVGAAMARCPDGIPWHRVINSQGKISLRDPSAVRLQRERLASEGIHFDEGSRIDLGLCRWEPDGKGRPV